jgi:hypothetical protein
MKKTLEFLKPSKFKSPKTYSGKEFSGILLEPIMKKAIPQPLGKDQLQDAQINELAKEVVDLANHELGKRILALADHYEIPIDNEDFGATLFAIVKNLGRDFLPGFQLNMRRPETRPSNSHSIGGVELFEAVNGRRNLNNETVKQACTFLNRRGPAKMKNAGAKNLEAAYFTFRKSVEDAYDYFHGDDYYSKVIRTLGFEAFHEQVENNLKNTKA